MADRARIAQQAAQRHGVPWFILGGVWMLETGAGANVKTSSAGAEGDFQFIPGTAQSYRYPLTNRPTDAQFAVQADAAARYLADLHKQHGGNWDAALRAYSGGGYGLDQVKHSSFNRLTTFGKSTPHLGDDVLSGPSGGPGGLLTAPTRIAAKATGIDGIAKFLGFLLMPKTWLRVLELIGGLVIGYFALKQLAATGSSANA